MNYTGGLPINIAVTAVQLTTIGNRDFLYLDDGGMVHFVSEYVPEISFDMGADVANKEVVEFTMMSKTRVLCKNVDGVVVEYMVPHFAGKAICLGVVDTNIIKVAGGQMLKHDGISYIVTSDGEYLPTASNGEFDIQDKREGGGYTVDVNNNLLFNESVIASGVASVGYFYQEGVNGITHGGSSFSDSVKNLAYSLFSQHNLDAEWKLAYDNTASTIASGLYRETQTNRLSTVQGVLARTLSGLTYKLDGATLIPQIDTDLGANGYNAMTTADSSKFIIFEPTPSNPHVYFSDSELGSEYPNQNELIFARRA